MAKDENKAQERRTGRILGRIVTVIVALFALKYSLDFAYHAIGAAREFVTVKEAEAESWVKNIGFLRRIFGADEKSVDELIQLVETESGVPATVIKAIIIRESGPKMRPDRVREEPHLRRYFEREPEMTDAEHRMLSSSHGLMQVIYGFHKERCGLKSYSDLYDPLTNLRCGVRVLQDCKAEFADKNIEPAVKLRKALACYNGGKGGSHTEAATQYASEVMLNLATLLVNDLENKHKTG